MNETAKLTDLLQKVKIVLVRTSHPGNIGAAARAMRVMGIQKLSLVAPNIFPSARADAMSSGALDVLRNAEVTDDLETAVADCRLVIATTARQRHLGMITASLADTVPIIMQHLTQHVCDMTDHTQPSIAIVFGTERTGLTNHEIDLCQRLMHIPTAQDYASLNVASAVQVTAYALYQACLTDDITDAIVANTHQSCTHSEREHFYAHLERVMIETGFLDPQQPKHLMRRLRRLFHRADPDHNEINILRGILTACEKKYHVE